MKAWHAAQGSIPTLPELSECTIIGLMETRLKDGFPVMAETTRNHIFSKEISQVIIAAMVLAAISIEKIVCE